MSSSMSPRKDTDKSKRESTVINYDLLNVEDNQDLYEETDSSVSSDLSGEFEENGKFVKSEKWKINIFWVLLL